MIETLIHDFEYIFTIAWVLALLKIIMIDIVLSWDNAIVIGIATAKLPEHLRKKAITLGIVAATILRVLFAALTVYLLMIPWLHLIGGLLLLWICYKFFIDLRHHASQEIHIKARNTYVGAISTIILADVSMSLDNVLAVAGASNENLVILGIWLIFSILLMAFAANYIAKKIHTYPIIAWIGLLVIFYVALEMILKDRVLIYTAISHFFS